MACLVASLLCKIGVHKQIANRVLEPWMHMCVIVSATDYRHMFGLRDHEDAQPEFACLVRYMRHELYQSTPRLLLSGEWHLPLVPLDGKESMPPQSEWPKVSAGRCARISYLTHDGKRDATSDVKLSEQLAANGHWSPFEHPATPLDSSTRLGNFRGWKQLRKFYDNEFLEG